VALLQFNFYYGGLIHWLEAEYTNGHRDWLTVNDSINAVHRIEPPAGYP
jgi:hypothetical protein